MKFSAFAMTACLGLTVTISAAAAATDVTSRYATWEDHLRGRVNELLFYPQAAQGAAGDVLVGFRVGENGRPTDVLIRQSSGQPIFDRQALILVSRLGRIGPIPANGGSDEVVLKLSYGDSSSTVAQTIRLAKDDRDEQRENEIRARKIAAGEVKVAQER